MKKYITIPLILLPSFVYAQSVYMHEAQEDGGSLNGLDTIMTVLGVLLLGFFLLFLLPLVVRDQIKDAKTDKEIKRQVEKEREELAEKQKAEKDARANAVPKAIDLGLSVKWSAFNFYAYDDYDAGKHYRWGDLGDYTPAVYQLLSRDFNKIGDISGNPEFDIVSKTWADGWRIPTKEEFHELVRKCVWMEEVKNGVKGYSIKGPNGNTIFLPSTGYYDNSWGVLHKEVGSYWTSTPVEDLKDSSYSYTFGDNIKSKLTFRRSLGSLGKAIRPVKN